MYMITESGDYHALSQLFRDSGLDVKVEETAPPETLRMWECTDPDTGELLGGSVLQYRSGCYVLSGLAVKEGLRRSGIGKKLMQEVLDEARARGASEIWGCAKVPEYYLTKGWVEIPRETAPAISHCQVCPQYGETCFPSIIRKDL